jgi:hypothetical protein
VMSICGLSVMSMCGLSVMKTSELICLNVGDMNLLLCNGHPLFFFHVICTFDCMQWSCTYFSLLKKLMSNFFLFFATLF